MNIDPIKHIAKDARILIVDDERKNVVALGQILSRAGYAICISITDPRQAVVKFEELQPDLLLLDWHMGKLNGKDVLDQIRAIMPEEKMPPVLVLTADDSAETRREALAAGVTDFLSKPLDYSEVLLRIHNLLMLRMFHLADQSEKKSLEDQVREKTAELERALNDLRESQHQVIQQERLRAFGAMAGGIAHDFNNVLTIIMGYADMFHQQADITAGPEAALDAFHVIGRAASDAAEVVRRLREFYRPFKLGEDDHRPVNLRDIVEEAVQLSVPRWRTQPQAAGIFIDVRTEFGETPGVSGSAAELREVLMNLIFNAVDAMPQGGQIVVRTGVEEDEGRVYFEVEDTGTGMTDETRRHCLEPFYTTKGPAGTGLGLATTYGIVQRHGGIIRLESRINQGTLFTILLPIAKPVEDSLPANAGVDAGSAIDSDDDGKISPQGDDSATGAATPPPAVKHTWATAPLEPPARAPHKPRVPPHSLRVLVVDDQPDICFVLRHYLEGDAHKVVTAANGCEALEKFRDTEFDVVITDRAMPKMNGDQLASAIKGIHPGEPVILLTAYAGDPEKFSPDIDMQLSKPVTLHKIRQAIRSVMAA